MSKEVSANSRRGCDDLVEPRTGSGCGVCECLRAACHGRGEGAVGFPECAGKCAGDAAVAVFYRAGNHEAACGVSGEIALPVAVGVGWDAAGIWCVGKPADCFAHTGRVGAADDEAQRWAGAVGGDWPRGDVVVRCFLDRAVARIVESDVFAAVAEIGVVCKLARDADPAPNAAVNAAVFRTTKRRSPGASVETVNANSAPSLK